MTEVESEILTLEEVAAYLKAGKRTVYRLAQKGEIPAFKLGGTWRFRSSELDRWIAGSRKTSTRISLRQGERAPSRQPNHIRERTKGRIVGVPVPVIDLFAGPGGLGEGFASLQGHKRQPFFEIALSIEKDAVAHRTLTLRAVFRRLRGTRDVRHYYSYIRGEIDETAFRGIPAVASARQATYALFN